MMRAFLIAMTSLLMSSALAHAAPVNQFCPVITEEEIDPEITTVYQGKTIAFCCDRCLAKFKADPEKYVSRLAAVMRAAAPSDSHQHDTPAKEYNHHAEGNHENHETSLPPETVNQTDGHEHDHGSPAGGQGEPPILGRLHPVIVHFPIAGVPLALLGFVLWLLTGRDSFAKADVPPLVVATAAAIVAVITGNIAHDSMRFSSSMHVIVERHQFVATAVMIVCLLMMAIRLWRWNRLIGRWRWVYGGGLIIASVLLGVTGFLGGSLVFGPDHLKW